MGIFSNSSSSQIPEAFSIHTTIPVLGASSGNSRYLTKYAQQAIISKQVKYKRLAWKMSNEILTIGIFIAD